METRQPRINVSCNDPSLPDTLQPLVTRLEEAGYDVRLYAAGESFPEASAQESLEAEFDYEFGAENDAASINRLIAEVAAELPGLTEKRIRLLEDDGEKQTPIYES